MNCGEGIEDMALKLIVIIILFANANARRHSLSIEVRFVIFSKANRSS